MKQIGGAPRVREPSPPRPDCLCRLPFPTELLRPADHPRALDSPDQSIGAICDYTAKMVEVGGPDSLPCWMQLQAMAWEDFRAPGLERGTAPNPHPTGGKPLVG